LERETWTANANEMGNASERFVTIYKDIYISCFKKNQRTKISRETQIFWWAILQQCTSPVDSSGIL